MAYSRCIYVISCHSMVICMLRGSLSVGTTNSRKAKWYMLQVHTGNAAFKVLIHSSGRSRSLGWQIEFLTTGKLSLMLQHGIQAAAEIRDLC